MKKLIALTILLFGIQGFASTGQLSPSLKASLRDLSSCVAGEIQDEVNCDSRKNKTEAFGATKEKFFMIQVLRI